jgi:hypothetical protein
MGTWEPGGDSKALWKAIEALCGTRDTVHVVRMLESIHALLEANPFDLKLGDLVDQLQRLREMRETAQRQRR